jgi:hypothetical protein
MISTAALRDENVAALQRSPTLRAKSRVKRARLTASALSQYDRLSNIETTRRQCGSDEEVMGVLIGQVPAGFGFGCRAAGLALGYWGIPVQKWTVQQGASGKLSLRQSQRVTALR